MPAKYTRHTKVAGYFGDVWRGTREVSKSLVKDPHFMGGVALMGVAGAAGLAGRGVDRLMQARQKATAYKEMLSMHPHLKQRNQKEISRIYNSVHNVNPMLARDPLIAGALVDNIVESANTYQGQANLGLISMAKDLSGIRSSISMARKAESPGLGPALHGSTKQLGESALTRMTEIAKEKGEVASTRATAERQKELLNQTRATMALDRASRAMNDEISRAHKAGVPIDPPVFIRTVLDQVKQSALPHNRLLAAVLR